MAKLRKASAYRKIERPYTRKSKYRKKNFVRASPNNLVVKYELGSPTRKFPWKLSLICDEDCQIRHNAIEAARKSANKLLETRLQKNFYLKLKMFPHHVLRENPLASGAGADRMSTGMKMSFGKPIGVAAQCRRGKILVEVYVDEKDIETGILALKRMQYKFPVRCLIHQEKLVEVAKPKAAKARQAPVVEEAKPEEPKPVVEKQEDPKEESKVDEPEVVEEPKPEAPKKAPKPEPAPEAPQEEHTPIEAPVKVPEATAPDEATPAKEDPVPEEKPPAEEAPKEEPVKEKPIPPKPPVSTKKEVLQKEGDEAKEILKDLKVEEKKEASSE